MALVPLKSGAQLLQTLGLYTLPYHPDSSRLLSQGGKDPATLPSCLTFRYSGRAPRDGRSHGTQQCALWIAEREHMA